MLKLNRQLQMNKFAREFLRRYADGIMLTLPVLRLSPGCFELFQVKTNGG